MNARENASVMWAWKQEANARKRMNQAKEAWVADAENVAKWSVWQSAEDEWVVARDRSDKVVSDMVMNRA